MRGALSPRSSAEVGVAAQTSGRLGIPGRRLLRASHPDPISFRQMPWRGAHATTQSLLPLGRLGARLPSRGGK
jgi:hypothetical protein